MLSATDEKAWDPSLWNLAGAQSLSGESVTEESALTYSAVYNATTLIAGTVGALPLHLMRKKTRGGTQIADNRPIYRVLHDQANEYMTAMAFRECMMAHVLLWGNGYAEIVRNELGDVKALWPIPPNRVRVTMEGGRLVYKIRVDRKDIVLPRERVLHVPGLGFDGFMGYSVVGMARKSIGLGMALETFGSLYFGQGTHPGTIISHPGKLTDSAHKNLQDSLMTAYSGLGQSHRLLLIEEGMKVEKFGVPPEDSQFLQSRQHQIPEIARWFNLPPHKLKDLTKSSFSNIESEQISFVTDSILPWLIRLEANYNMQLLRPNEAGRQKLYFKHVVEGLLRGDSASRAAFYSTMFGIGAMSVNEIREKEDMNPVEGGDEHFVPMNMTTLEEAGKPAPPPPPPPDPMALPPKPNGEDTDEQIPKEE